MPHRKIVMPVRKVVTRSGKKFRGRFPSKKNGISVAWESLEERDAIRYLEYHSGVVSYEEQPSEETYYVEGVPHSYFPDLRARLVNGQVVDIEVKPSRKLRKKQLKEKYGRIASMYKKAGRNFRILTERDYRAQPLHSNLKRVHRASKLIWCEADVAILLARLGPGPRWTLEQAGRLVGNVERALALVAWRALCIDLRALIKSQTPVWLPQEVGGVNDPVQL